MRKPIFVLNGPNLNRSGAREPSIYGTMALAAINEMCVAEAVGETIDFRQSNHEGTLIEWVHEAIDAACGIVINPGAYSFTSIALLDALKMFAGPIVEIHITNIHKREPSYHRSYVSLVATGVISGCGAFGYRIALQAVLNARASPATR